MDGGVLLDILALLVRELALFAAVGFLILGASDLLVDFIWIGLKLQRGLLQVRSTQLDDLSGPQRPGCMAVFVPAWHEQDVVGRMLANAIVAWNGAEFRIFVGCYPNDPATIAAVTMVTGKNIRLVIGDRPGPTTKADNLNTLWAALLEGETKGERYKAVILHDAEDVVHSAELALFDRMIERFDLVQLPVLPLIPKRKRGVSAHYVDEFCESHGKELVVREALGAGIPSAGVGCAISREAMALLAGTKNAPFDADSLTEDYEIGLKLHALGRRGTFVRLPASSGGVISTREHFPTDFRGAIAQKSRWIAGIALSGWDRLGWRGGIAERWMRLRDRQAPLAALLLVIAYSTFLAMPLLALASDWAGHPVLLITPPLVTLMTIAAGLLVWRLLMRFAFVARSYGVVEGLRAVPRVIVSNAIAILAAREALGRYARTRRTGTADWGKTTHVFPDQVPAE